ncbi:MAG TPA: ATPase, T2SS/T4P/T4SS family, partial [Candidatus Gracilibacteria bacterium]|nr:ATPase, T2SS/T4P/T4SS family [Candidatus Gracilibacteria bacterium]
MADDPNAKNPAETQTPVAVTTPAPATTAPVQAPAAQTPAAVTTVAPPEQPAATAIQAAPQTVETPVLTPPVEQPATPAPVATPPQTTPPPVQAATPQAPQPEEQKPDERLSKINLAFKEKAVAGRAKELGMSYVNIGATPLNPDLLKILTPETARKALILPFFKLGKKLRIAVADHENPETKKVIEDLKAQGYALNINLATDEGLLDAMKLYDTDQYRVRKGLDTSLEEAKIKAYAEEIKGLKELEQKIKTVTSEEAVYLVNVGALKTGASDIHYEPEEKGVKVRFRIDGLLHTIFQIDKSVFVNMGNQIKYQCKMKLNIANEPQDGRYGFVVNDRKVDLRVSSLPTEYGETFVCRLLDSSR